MMEEYYVSFNRIWVLLTLIVIEAIISIGAQELKRYVPGITNPDLGPESFVFRSDRAFKNFGKYHSFRAALLSILLSMDPVRLSKLVIIYVLACVFTQPYIIQLPKRVKPS